MYSGGAAGWVADLPPRCATSGASEININLVAKRYGSNELSVRPEPPAGGDSRPLERFMRFETVAKNLLLSNGKTVVSKIRLDSVPLLCLLWLCNNRARIGSTRNNNYCTTYIRTYGTRAKFARSMDLTRMEQL